MRILVATDRSVLALDSHGGRLASTRGLAAGRPTALAWDQGLSERAWCGTEAGAYVSDDEGRSWRAAGLEGERIMSMAVSPAAPGVVYAGTEPSAVWRREDDDGWQRLTGLAELPSSSEWSFPPRPETHHVRWIACDPHHAGRLWVAVEAGALIATTDGGRSWRDRVPGGPYDTHELAIHPDRPGTLRVAAGDGYYESDDAGLTWRSPRAGLEVGYLRSVAIDSGNPENLLVSGASGPRSTYVAGRSDGRLYRRSGTGPWRRVDRGWPDPPATIAPLLRAGVGRGEFWAADERGVHRSSDGGESWEPAAAFDDPPAHLRGLAVRR